MDRQADGQAEVIAFLESGALGGDGPPGRVDTHAASVFLAGDRAWKLKRAVRFDYLDFSTPDRRREALETELELNRRTAPGLYLAVHPVTRAAGGELEIGGTGEPVDWLLEMERFPDDALLSAMADRGALDEPLLTALAERIARFHESAGIVENAGGAATIRAIVEGNATSIAAFPGEFAPAGAAELVGAQLAEIDRLAPLLDERARAGRIRHAHGDLHLANIAMIHGEPTPFDCLEFDAKLASIDVFYDLAFLLMDLWQRGLARAANTVFNRYLDLSPEDEGGAPLMPLFLSVRATIRAHVLAAQAARGGGDADKTALAHACFELARRLLAPVPPRMIAVGGLSGTGKSTLARAIAAAFGAAPGARILRSDVLRKRLAGVGLDGTLPPESYTAEGHARVYAELDRLAGLHLDGGWTVFADAVFSQPEERRSAEAVAAVRGVPFSGIWLTAPTDIRAGRVDRRTNDPSDADAGVARRQASYDIGELGGWREIAAGRPLEEVARDAIALLKG